MSDSKEQAHHFQQCQNTHQNQMRDASHIWSNQDCNKRDYNIVDTNKKSINSRPKVAQY
jgi:hypothetical protein